MPSELLDPRKIRQELARRRLLDFTTYTFPGYNISWHHRVVCNYLDRFIRGEIKRLMLFMPPRHSKSELVSRRLPAMIFGRFPDASIIAASYATDLASRMNRDVQRIIDDERYRELFPETTLSGTNIRSVAQGSWLRNSDIFEIVGHRGVYRSAGIGSGITGMGFTHGIIDDPVKDREQADSVAYREAVVEWYTSTFHTRQMAGAGILVTLTRWHENDLAGWLLQKAAEDPNADQWVVVRFPAIAEADASADDPREPGEALWPDEFGLPFLNSVKANSSRDFTALYQQRPSPADGGMVKRDWFRFWKSLPETFDEVIESWDMTFKDTKTSDFVVGQVWGRRAAEYYLLDQTRARMDFPSTTRAVERLSTDWPQALTKLVEDKANGPAVIDTLRGRIPGLIAVNPEGSKEARLASVTPLIEAGNVYLPDPSVAPWVHDFIEECAGFPNAAHDDQVDAMSQALRRMSQHRPNGGIWV